MENIPRTIFLQVDADGERPKDFLPLRGVSWCQDKINKSDLEYRYVNPEEVGQPVLGTPVFEFQSFNDWLDRGRACYRPFVKILGRDHGIILLDSKGYLLRCGGEIKTASELGNTPFRAYQLKTHR